MKPTSTSSSIHSSLIETRVDPTSARFEKNMRAMAELVTRIRNEEDELSQGGGSKAIEAQHAKGG